VALALPSRLSARELGLELELELARPLRLRAQALAQGQVAAALPCMASVVVPGSLGQLAALREPARFQTPTSHNVFRQPVTMARGEMKAGHE